jgi:hypothetical protein
LNHQKLGKVKAVTKDCHKNRTKNNQINVQENERILNKQRTASKADRICKHLFHFPNSDTNEKNALKRTFHREIENRELGKLM